MATKKVSATEAKLQFGKLMAYAKSGNPVVIEKNNEAEIVWISIDDYEDFLEINDDHFEKSIHAGKKEIKDGTFGSLDDLHAIHKKTIINEGEDGIQN